MPNRHDLGWLHFTSLPQTSCKSQWKPSIFLLAHTSISLLLCNYLLSGSVIVLCIAAMQTQLLGGKMPLGPTRFSCVGNKRCWSLRALNMQLSMFNFPKNENCQKAKCAGDIWLDAIAALCSHCGGCPLNIWEHSLAHCHGCRFQRSWQHPALPNSKQVPHPHPPAL